MMGASDWAREYRGRWIISAIRPAAGIMQSHCLDGTFVRRGTDIDDGVTCLSRCIEQRVAEKKWAEPSALPAFR